MSRDLEKDMNDIKKKLAEIGQEIDVIKGKDLIPVEEENGKTRYEPRDVVVISQLLRDFMGESKGKGTVRNARIIHAGRIKFDTGHSQWINTEGLGVISIPDQKIIDFVTPFTSNQRIKIMKSLMQEKNGKTSTKLGIDTELDSGPLYHHLRELSSAGFIYKEKRGRYHLSVKGTIALLTISHMAKAADDLADKGITESIKPPKNAQPESKET